MNIGENRQNYKEMYRWLNFDAFSNRNSTKVDIAKISIFNLIDPNSLYPKIGILSTFVKISSNPCAL